MKPHTTTSNSVDTITQAIVIVRGQRVLLDVELAALYGVPTKSLNQAVKRNSARFPTDFLFQLNPAETKELNRSQNVTGSQRHRDPRHTPYAFTEHGAIMAASVLKSARAVEMSVYIVRAFVELRSLLETNLSLHQQLDELEKKYRNHDEAIAAIISAIRDLMSGPSSKRRGIGFTADFGP